MKSELEEMRARQIMRYMEIIFSILTYEDIQQTNINYYTLLYAQVKDYYTTHNRIIPDAEVALHIRQAIAELAVMCLEDGTILAHLSPQELYEELEPMLARNLARLGF